MPIVSVIGILGAAGIAAALSFSVVSISKPLKDVTKGPAGLLIGIGLAVALLGWGLGKFKKGVA